MADPVNPKDPPKSSQTAQHATAQVQPKNPTTSASGQTIINQPADTAVQPDVSMSEEEVNALKGDLKPGEVGWVELDEEGKPTSGATKEPPPPGKSAARVVHVNPRRYDEVLTPSGAPVTKMMNPEPERWDEGMLQRNPPGGTAQRANNPDRHGHPEDVAKKREEDRKGTTT